MSSHRKQRRDLEKQRAKLVAEREQLALRNKQVAPQLAQPHPGAQVGITQLASFEAEQYQSPLPTPKAMAGYQQVDPALVSWMTKQVEEQAAHRREMESTLVRGQLSLQRNGQVIGGAIGVGCLVVAAMSVVLGHPLGLAAILIPALQIADGLVRNAKQKPPPSQPPGAPPPPQP